MCYTSQGKLVNVLNFLNFLNFWKIISVKMIATKMIATKIIFVILYSDWQALVIMFFEPNIFWERNMVTCDLAMAPAFLWCKPCFKYLSVWSCSIWSLYYDENLIFNIYRCGVDQYKPYFTLSCKSYLNIYWQGVLNMILALWCKSYLNIYRRGVLNLILNLFQINYINEGNPSLK